MTATSNPPVTMAPRLPTPAELAELEQDWCDPGTAASPLLSYHEYAQPSRDGGRGDVVGSYFRYLPPSYDERQRERFPVLFWLHGGMSHSRQGVEAVDRLDAAMRSGAMPETIVIVPQALPIGWYVDAKDGSRPVEQTVVRDLLAHVDARYRTTGEPSGRFVEGFSMGGYGALHLAFKHPGLFGRVSAIAPSILRDMSAEPDERTANTFFGDQAYYDACGPWSLLLANAPAIRRQLEIRLVYRLGDERQLEMIRQLDQEMTDLGVGHQTRGVDCPEHRYPDMMDALGTSYAEFWA